MAATKFSAVYTYEDGTMFIAEFKSLMTYKIAELMAKENNIPEVTLVCVIESWKLYPKKNEKTETKQKI